MSTNAALHFGFDAFEAVNFADDSADEVTIKHTLDAAKILLTSSSAPAQITEAWSLTFTFVGTTPQTIDLTALAQAGRAAALDLTGKKVQAFIMSTPTGNAGDVVITPGAANGYNLFGDAAAQNTMGGGELLMRSTPENLPDVAGAAKDITFTPTDSGTLTIILVAG